MFGLDFCSCFIKKNPKCSTLLFVCDYDYDYEKATHFVCQIFCSTLLQHFISNKHRKNSNKNWAEQKRKSFEYLASFCYHLVAKR